MTDILTIGFEQAFGKDIGGHPVTVRYALTVEFTTPDRNGEDYENATIRVKDFTRFEGANIDLFAYLKDESEIPQFYAKVRELARLEYVARRLQIQ